MNVASYPSNIFQHVLNFTQSRVDIQVITFEEDI